MLAAAGARGIDGLSGYILLMYIQRSVRKRIRHNSCQSVIRGNLMSYAIGVTQWEQAHCRILAAVLLSSHFFSMLSSVGLLRCKSPHFPRQPSRLARN